MTRLYWTLRLRHEERYLEALKCGGWPEHAITSVSMHCEALRVKLALAPPMDRQDVITVSASFLALCALGVILCL